MMNSSFYAAFERMWQHIVEKFNNYVLTEVFDIHIADMENPHSVTKEHIGLENVDNTADLDKPISYATQAVLDGKADVELITIDDIDGICNTNIINAAEVAM